MIWLAIITAAAIVLYRARPITTSEIQGHDLVRVLRGERP